MLYQGPAPLIMLEIHEVVFAMEHNKAPNLNGSPVELYQHFWGVIEANLLANVSGSLQPVGARC